MAKAQQTSRAQQASHRERARAQRIRNWRQATPEALLESADECAVIDCGWGRLIFAQTFPDTESLMQVLREEAPDERDIAIYAQDPHVALTLAPQELFLDPSHTYRLDLSHYRPARRPPRGFIIRRLRTRHDGEAVNRIYAKHNMVPVPLNFFMKNRNSRQLTYLVAEDAATGEVVGTVTGVDHKRAFNDPQLGSSLWCLAVEPQTSQPGIGEALVRQLAEHYQARGRSWMDLSVLHDNRSAIRLYEKLGFQRIPVFCLKHKNPINEKLFAGPSVSARLNPYAQIIINEARRRGIAVEIEDEEGGFFALAFGGRTISCRESLSDLTTAVAMSRCDDKAVTRRMLQKAGLLVPEQIEAGDPPDNVDFLAKHQRLVVKPARGEQGAGISVDIRDEEGLQAAITKAQRVCDRVLLEQLCPGQDLRIITIGYKVVAAAVRRPAAIVGDGRSTVRSLIRTQSRRRAAATGGESTIPLDEETERCVRLAGYDLEEVLAEGTHLEVRKTANLHTGGTIHDVTDRLHPALVEAAVRASRILQIPVVGFDFLVPSAEEGAYVVIEANERPGLANHEPQPTAQRFIDLLFPQTAM